VRDAKPRFIVTAHAIRAPCGRQARIAWRSAVISIRSRQLGLKARTDGWPGKSDRSWQTRAGRNDDGPLQSGDRTSVAGRGFAARQTEAAVGVVVLNQVLSAGRPDAVRRMRVVA
jgi:hypothetical protein